MEDLSSVEIDNIQKKISSLKEKLKTQEKNHALRMYELISNLYNEERKLRPNFTLRQLALENNMDETTVYSYYSWRTASTYTRKMVKEGKISHQKAIRVLRTCAKGNQDIAIKEIIKNNYSSNDISSYLKGGKFDTKITKIKEYKNNSNIGRDLLNYCARFQMTLLKIEKLPTTMKTEVLSELKKTKTQIENAIVILEK